jgi:hypothetical protein
LSFVIYSLLLYVSRDFRGMECPAASVRLWEQEERWMAVVASTAIAVPGPADPGPQPGFAGLAAGHARPV